MQHGTVRRRLSALLAVALPALVVAGCLGSSSSKTTSGSSQIDRASAACQRIKTAVQKRPQVQLTTNPTAAQLRRAAALQERYDLPAFRQALADIQGIEPRENVVAWNRFRGELAAYDAALGRQVEVMKAGDVKAFEQPANNPQRLAHAVDTAAEQAGATSCAFL